MEFRGGRFMCDLSSTGNSVLLLLHALLFLWKGSRRYTELSIVLKAVKMGFFLVLYPAGASMLIGSLSLINTRAMQIYTRLHSCLACVLPIQQHYGNKNAVDGTLV